MELTYTKNGDYFIPNLVIPEEKRPIKKYGNLRKKYLKEYHTGIYQGMLLSCKLWEHLADVEEQAQQRLDVLIEQMKKVEGITEELKAVNQMKWVQEMNDIIHRAEEIIFQELIYTL